MTATSIVCESHIRRVTVYARGAVVARRLALPEELPEDATDLTVSGVTALAEPGRRFGYRGHRVVVVQDRVGPNHGGAEIGVGQS